MDYIRAAHKLHSISKLLISKFILLQVFFFSFFFLLLFFYFKGRTLKLRVLIRWDLNLISASAASHCGGLCPYHRAEMNRASIAVSELTPQKVIIRRVKEFPSG